MSGKDGAKTTITCFFVLFFYSEEDMKVSANLVMKFIQAENGVLRYLSRAISNNYLQSMPVYRDTLLRKGKRISDDLLLRRSDLVHSLLHTSNGSC